MLVNGNAKRIALADGVVHCVVTSPPYWNLRDYGIAGQIGLETTIEAYVAAMVEVGREVRRVLRDDGSFWLNLGDSYASQEGPEPKQTKWKVNGASNTQNGGQSRNPGSLKPKDLCMIPARVALALQADGWWLRSDIIWHKPNPMPESVTDRPTSAHEYLFLLTKSARYFYDAEAVRVPLARKWDPKTNGDSWAHTSKQPVGSKAGHHSGDYPEPNPNGANRRSVWTIATESYKGAHYATFPRALVSPCILAGTSARGVCRECGKPWERVVERSKSIITKPRPFSKNGNDDRNDTGRIYEETETTTTGWRPTCTCNAPIVPAIVLDPFCGSGTTGQVAHDLGRRFVGIDLSASYLAYNALPRAERKTAAASMAELPLFAELVEK
jgi:DNA modification methylase